MSIKNMMQYSLVFKLTSKLSVKEQLVSTQLSDKFSEPAYVNFSFVSYETKKSTVTSLILQGFEVSYKAKKSDR